MKKLLLSLTLLCFVGFTHHADARRPLAEPELVALYFYADWCGSCKIVSANMAQARQADTLDKKNILFVKLNLTDKTTIHQSILHAQALGFGNFIKEQGSKTGYVAVMDAKKKEEVFRVNKTVKPEEISQKFLQALKQSD